MHTGPLARDHLFCAGHLQLDQDPQVSADVHGVQNEAFDFVHVAQDMGGLATIYSRLPWHFYLYSGYKSLIITT